MVKKFELAIVMDFDGVFTQASKHAETITFAAVEELGVSKEDYERAEKKVLKKPIKYTWKVNNEVGSFGDEDPFMKAAGILKVLCKKYGVKDFDTFCLQKFNEVSETLPPYFQDGVKETLEGLKSLANVTIVTNSKTSKVERMLKEISVEVDVIGGATKYYVDQSFDKVPKTLKVYNRKINLRRPSYYEILGKLKRKKTVVIGDVLSMDLALPHHLGMEIVLKENDYTPEWSKKFVKKEGRVIKNLAQLIDIAKKI